MKQQSTGAAADTSQTPDLVNAETQQPPAPVEKKKGPRRQVTFEYGKGDRVLIIANGCPGEVIRMLCDSDRLLYEVRYADLNNCTHDRWIPSEELTATK